MALLTLGSDQTLDNWSALEDKLANWLPGLAPASQTKDTRTYRLDFPEQDQPIPLLQKLQSLLAEENVHFFIDLKP
ncbi:MAG: hypothetical protein ABFS09_05365 [Thermodesulfobacteriota bacterium]